MELHASMTVRPRRRPAGAPFPAPTSLEEIRASCPVSASVDDFYDTLRAGGNQYGPDFRSIERLWRGIGEALGELRIHGYSWSGRQGDLPLPILLDVAAQLVLAATDREVGRVVLLLGIDHCWIEGPPAGRCWAHARLQRDRPWDDGVIVGDVSLHDDAGRVSGQLSGVRFQQLAQTGGEGQGAVGQAMTIAVAATFTATPLGESLAFWMDELGLPADVRFTPFNQPFQQLLDPFSVLGCNRNGLNVVLVRFEDWLPAGGSQAVVPEPGELEQLLGDRPSAELPNGMKVAHLNRYETEALYREVFEEESYLRHEVTLPDGARVIDAGANIGLFALQVQQRSRGARIYAFEPSPAAFEALAINTRLYGPDVEVVPCGLGADDGEAPFTFYRKSSVFSGFHADDVQDRTALKAAIKDLLRERGLGDEDALETAGEELTMDRLDRQTLVRPIRTLSSFIKEQRLDRIDLLKIDVEKSELDLLAGIRDEDWSIIRQVVVEVHEGDDRRAGEVAERLRGRGFNVVVDEQDAPVDRVCARFMRGASSRNSTSRLRPRERPGNGTGWVEASGIW